MFVVRLTIMVLATLTGRVMTNIAGDAHQIRHLYAAATEEPKMSSEKHQHHHPLTYYYTNDLNYQHHQPYYSQHHYQPQYFYNRALLDDKSITHHQPMVRYHHLMHKDSKNQHKIALLPTMLLLSSLPSILISLLTSPIIINLLLQILKQLNLIQLGLVVNPNVLAVPATSKLASKQQQFEDNVKRAIKEGKLEYEH